MLDVCRHRRRGRRVNLQEVRVSHMWHACDAVRWHLQRINGNLRGSSLWQEQMQGM